jgi:predicted flap endonuclease-1-like 5' DNA nuclease
MDTCTLIPIIVGLISALLGYLLGKLAGGDNSELEMQLQECKSKLANLEMENSRVANVMSAPAIVFNAGEAKAIFGRTVKENDLTIVEGIGPKIQELFHKGGVHTWKSLSETTVARCQEILDGAGSAYAVHKPGSWPEQAKFAYEGRWKELKDWQDDLDGGK